MKVRVSRKVGYFEVDARFELKLGDLFRRLQEAAITHSERVGLGSKALAAVGKAWVLARMQADIRRYPRHHEEVTVVTWHRGAQGYRAFRDFVVRVGDEPVATATSLWLFVDLQRKRLLRVPEDTVAAYTVESDVALGDTVARWKPDLGFEPACVTRLATRAGDYDFLGHVNNAVYFDFLETLTSRAFETPRRIRRLKIEFKKEIDRQVETLCAGLLAGTPCRFKLYRADSVYAGGELELAP